MAESAPGMDAPPWIPPQPKLSSVGMAELEPEADVVMLFTETTDSNETSQSDNSGPDPVLAAWYAHYMAQATTSSGRTNASTRPAGARVEANARAETRLVASHPSGESSRHAPDEQQLVPAPDQAGEPMRPTLRPKLLQVMASQSDLIMGSEDPVATGGVAPSRPDQPSLVGRSTDAQSGLVMGNAEPVNDLGPSQPRLSSAVPDEQSDI